MKSLEDTGKSQLWLSTSIIGSVLSWPALAYCYVAWPNSTILDIGLGVTGACTIMMITQVFAQLTHGKRKTHLINASKVRAVGNSSRKFA